MIYANVVSHVQNSDFKCTIKQDKYDEINLKWFSAVEEGDIATMERMIDEGINLYVPEPSKHHPGGRLALKVAIDAGQIGAVKLLLESGFDPNHGVPDQDSEENQANVIIYGKPQVVCCSGNIDYLIPIIVRGDIDMLYEMLKHRCHPNSYNGKEFLLALCVAEAPLEKLAEMIDLLCTFGADSYAVNSSGRTIKEDLEAKQVDPERIKILFQNVEPFSRSWLY